MGKYSTRSKASNKGRHHIWDIWMGWWLGPFCIETCIEILYFVCFPFWDRFSLFFKMNASSASGEMRHSGNKRMAKTPKPCTPGLVIRWGITAQTSSPPHSYYEELLGEGLIQAWCQLTLGTPQKKGCMCLFWYSLFPVDTELAL